MKKKKFLILVCLALTSIIIFKLLSNKNEIDKKSQATAAKNVRIPVTVVHVSENEQEIPLVKTGLIVPLEEAKVLSSSNGNIKRLLFQIGDRVAKGQPLAVIDTQLLELELQKAESGAVKLKRDLQTYTELLEGNAATQEKVNTLKQNYDDAQNQVRQLQRQIADAIVKAPTKGIIATKTIEEGIYATASTEIASIVNLSKVKVVVHLSESDVYHIRLGQEIRLTTEVYPDRPFFGKITFISPRADEAYKYQVEITAPNDIAAPLRSGTFAYADFSRKTSQKILLIPRVSLNSSTKDATIYIVQHGKAVLRKIKVGAEYGSQIHVIDGLAKGNLIITSGQVNLKNGTLIKISDKK